MAINLKQAKYYFNREWSWLRFNERVLEEAMDESHPLLERMKFLSIFSSNNDEFFMIRVAGLMEQVHAGIHETAIDGFSPKTQLVEIARKTHEMVDLQSRVLLNDVLPKLRKKGIRIRFFNTLERTQKERLKRYFKDKVFPVLTPLAIDPAHPFPQLRNLGLNLLVELKEPFVRGESKTAVVPIPHLVSRFITVPGKNEHDFVLVEDLVRHHLDLLFPNMKIVKVSEFRVTRNADMDLSEAEADDLLKLIEKELRKRRLGTVIRVEVSDKMSLESRKFLQRMTGLHENDIYDISGYLDLAAFMFLMGLDRPKLKDKEFTPSLRREVTTAPDIFAAIRRSDILLHHPYDSFNHVVDLITEAAKDPDVLAIKQTLYRTSGKSPIVHALKTAVAKGKQVTALIELKARFDEENNIVWAKELERSGVNVVYGLLGLKTHCKILMIVRREGDEIRRYLHLGTGNYNDKTSKIYTDLGLMTCDPEIGKDASELFNLLTGYSLQENWRKLFVAPMGLRKNFLAEFQNCIKHHNKPQPSRIIMVMNSLVDPAMIQAMYRASQKGIKIDLVIRGICCLKPGIKGVSENITVRSIVGRFLEHCRIYHFHFGNEDHIYLGSADLMQRNLDRRIELIFPLENQELKNRVMDIVQVMLSDNVKARELNADGDYIRVKPKKGEPVTNVQEVLLARASERIQHIDTITVEN